MTDLDIRRLVAEALEYASVPGFSGGDKHEAFLKGADISLDNLEIDSLAAMELCIAIEANLDVTLLPAELQELGSLNDVVMRVEELLRA